MYKKHILKNGLTIMAEYIPHVKSISLGVWIEVGSRMENKENSGISHFIEHMLFKGTKNRTSKQIASEIDNLGGQINAFTSKECTCYYVKLLDSHITTGVDILSDMILNSKFDESDIDKERSVIIEELKMYEDSPDELSYDLLVENIYKDSSLGMNIIGTEETLENINKKELLEYFNTYYVPNNSVIAISGSFDFDEIVKLIEEKFGLWQKNDVEIKYEDVKFNVSTTLKEKDTEQLNVAIALEAIPVENKEEAYTLAVINTIFGGSISSRLFQKVREEKGLAYSIYSAHTLYKKVGELGIFLSLSNENLPKAYKAIISEIELLKNKYITQEELTNSKEQLKGSYLLNLESTSSKMMALGRSMITSKSIETTDDILNSIDNVDLESVKNLIDKIFIKDKLSICVVGRNVDDIEL